MARRTDATFLLDFAPAFQRTYCSLVKPVRIYTLRSCPYCVRAKSLLDRKKVGYDERDVTMDYEGRSRISQETGHRTFPQIFIGDEFVGGYDELSALERAGQLDEKLA